MTTAKTPTATHTAATSKDAIALLKADHEAVRSHGRSQARTAGEKRLSA